MEFNEGRTFGVEIEGFGVGRLELAQALRQEGIACAAEGYNHRTRSHWKLTTDSTIRPNGRGRTDTWELVSPVLRAREGLEEVKKVCRVLNSVGAKVNKTCGLHVHHDAQEFGATEAKNLIKLYARMEGTLDSGMPESRRGRFGHYCRSVLDRVRSNPQGLEACETMEQVRYYMGTRYLKLNVEAWWRHGTMEFRQHSGTTDAKKVVNWIVLTQIMIERAHRRVKMVLPEGQRYREMTPWRSVVLELGLEKKWSRTSGECRAAVQWFADRIKHFRNREATA